MIRITGLTKSYPARDGQMPILALQEVDLRIHDGEFVAVIGPSGCGKTTLLKILAGLVPWDAGEVTIDGTPVAGPGQDRAMVFQHFALLPWADVLTNICFGLELRGVPIAERVGAGRSLIERMGLGGFERRYPRELSGGMQQRVGLARALAVNPRIILMDEPFGSLDAQTRRLMQEDLLRFHETERRTVVFVTHSMDEAIRLSDRVVVMSPRPGRTLEEIAVPLPRPRPDGFMKLPAIVDLQERLWEMLRGMQSLAAGGAG